MQEARSCARDFENRLTGGASLRAIGYLVDRGPLEAAPSATCQLAGGGQRARLLESLSRCLGSAGAVSSALPWVAQPPSEQCANSWRCGVALSTVGAHRAEHLCSGVRAQVAGNVVCSGRWDHWMHVGDVGHQRARSVGSERVYGATIG